MKNVLHEAALVGAVGVVLAFVANAVSPRGLKLTRNYSPGGVLAASRTPGGAPDSNGLSQTQLLAQQFRAEGLQLADSNQVVKLFNDPRKTQDLVIFIDARDEDHYQAGHIPGAFKLDHYHPEGDLAVVLPVCQMAEQIVVYCKGGSCEDSEQTAIFLRDAGVPKDKLFVYAGGVDEWSSNHLPIEMGQRNSGQLNDRHQSTPSSAPEGPK